MPAIRYHYSLLSVSIKELAAAKPVMDTLRSTTSFARKRYSEEYTRPNLHFQVKISAN